MQQSCLDFQHPLKGIIYSEFDNKEGPQLKYSYPINLVSKETFEVLSDYIIVSKQCSEKLVVVAFDDMQFLNYSIAIENTKYHRNALIFAFGFIMIRGITDIEPYEKALRKIAYSIFNLETESEFLFQESSKQHLQVILETLFFQLTTNHEAFIDLNTNHNYLAVKLFKNPVEPGEINDYDVPMFRYESINLSGFPWDITFHHLIPHIDGVSHVKQIVHEVFMDSDIVKRTLKILLFYDMIIIADVFKFTNVYKLNTENAMSFFSNSDNMQELSNFATVKGSTNPPSYGQLMNFLLQLQPNKTMKEVILDSFSNTQYDDDDVTHGDDTINRYAIDLRNMDICKVIAFAKAKNLIRRLHEYPIFIPSTTASSNISPQTQTLPSLPILHLSTNNTNATNNNLYQFSSLENNAINNTPQYIIGSLPYKNEILSANSSTIASITTKTIATTTTATTTKPILVSDPMNHRHPNSISTSTSPNNSYTQRSLTSIPNILKRHSSLDSYPPNTNHHHHRTIRFSMGTTTSSNSTTDVGNHTTGCNIVSNISDINYNSIYEIKDLLMYLNGKEHIDSLCCMFGITYQDIIEYPGIQIVYK